MVEKKKTTRTQKKIKKDTIKTKSKNTRVKTIKKTKNKNVNDVFFNEDLERIFSGIQYFLGPAIALFLLLVLKDKKQELLKYHSALNITIYLTLLLFSIPLYFINSQNTFIIYFLFYLAIVLTLFIILLYSSINAFLGAKIKIWPLNNCVEKMLKYF